MNISRLLEITGIDLLPYAFGSKKIDCGATIEPTKLKGFGKSENDFDTDQLDEALNFSKSIVDEETARGEKIESKAINLMGITGISAAFITGVSSLLPKGNLPISWLIVLAIIYLSIVGSLTLTILLAARVITVGKYMRLNITNVFDMNTQKPSEIKRGRLNDYLQCYANNSKVHNEKASYLIGAQLWFKNSVFAFLVLSISLIPILFINNSTKNPTLEAIIVTPALLPNTQENLPLPTIDLIETKIQPTLTYKPSNTPTAKPTVTPTLLLTNIPITQEAPTP